MALSQKDLQAIKEIFDVRFDSLDGRMDKLDDRMDKLDGRMDKLQGRMDKLQGRMDKLQGQVDELQGDVKFIKVEMLENGIIPRLKTIEACFLDASNRYIKNSDLFAQKIEHIDTIDQVVTDHSKQICELQLKQA